MSTDFMRPSSTESPGESSISGNGNDHRFQSDEPFVPPHEEERKVNLRHAVFYLTVALVLILANRFGRVNEPQTSTDSRPSAQDVTLVLRLQAGVESQIGPTIRFRLGNGGRHSVFYPVLLGTSVPVGEIETKTSASSDWMPLSAGSQKQWSSDSFGRTLAWIEMPPGGWCNGEFSDPGPWPGEHAYAILLKPNRDANPVRILSEAYRSRPN